MSRIGSRTDARLLVVAAVTLLGFASSIPAAHAATGVTNVTVSNASPSTAASALTTYAIGFKSTSALVGSSGAYASITFPTGTVLSTMVGSPLMVGATQDGFCQDYQDSGPPIAHCYVYSGTTIAAGATVAISLNGVTNPPTVSSTDTLQINTTADTTVKMSPSYSVTTALAISKPSITISSPSSAANALTTYAIGFTTSATGAMSGASGSEIDITLPTGTNLTHIVNSPLTYAASQVGFCQDYQDSGPPIVHCYVYSGSTTPANAALTMTLNGVMNPGSAGTNQLTVTTSSDTKSIKSATYSVTPVSSISALTIHNTPPSKSAGALTTYTLTFKASATGGMSGSAGSEIDITFPAGTDLTHVINSPLTDGSQVGFCQDYSDGPPAIAHCYVYSGSATGADDTITMTLNGVINPKTAGNKTLSVSTSSDTSVVVSPSYSVGAQTAISGASIALASTITGATTNYTVKFTATTGLAGDSGSKVVVALGAGTNLTALTSSPLMVGTTQVGFCQKSPSAATTAICYVYTGSVVNAGDHVVASIMNVKNPAATAQFSLKLSTTSDTAVKSVPYCVAAAGVPCITKFSPSSGLVGDTVTIAGINLGSAMNVKFNGTVAAIGTNTATKITVTVPPGATTGKITVTTAAGTATSTKDFTVLSM